MDKVLEQLAKLLGVTVDSLQGIVTQIGGNYQEIYSTLVREYTLYSVLTGVKTFVFILFGIFGVACVFLDVNILVEGIYHDLDDSKKRFVKNAHLILLCLIILVCVTFFFPLFYPNLNLILGLLDR
ncbi:hypothetical protein ABQH43_01580 [Streptococcus sp. ZJ100]|uniref:hypothetical protein n=1 Tax=Streptococcus handemini TaxID=3161188 RepID=UPI0032EF690B